MSSNYTRNPTKKSALKQIYFHPFSSRPTFCSFTDETTTTMTFIRIFYPQIQLTLPFANVPVMPKRTAFISYCHSKRAQQTHYTIRQKPRCKIIYYDVISWINVIGPFCCYRCVFKLQYTLVFHSN